MTTQRLLLVTTPADASARFFAAVDGWQTTTVLYDDVSPGDMQTAYDAVYFRDPFNEGKYDEMKLEATIAAIADQQKAACFIDGVNSLATACIEDKWRQYELAREFFPETRILRSPSEVTEHTIAKKRISARARDIIFKPEQLATKSDMSEYIIQPRLMIQEEYRVYVVRGNVVPEGTLKSSKSQTRKVKVKAFTALPQDVIRFARELHQRVSWLDFYGLDIARTDDGLKLIEINRSPQFARYNELGNTNLAERVLQLVSGEREIYGSVETVKIPSFGIEVLAKVDTGAWSGTLHSTDIHEKDGKLYFTPLGNEKYATSIKQYEIRAVRSASGHEEERYIIPVTLEIKGKSYHTMLGLGDRGAMQREMLLGRKFLIENNILVDVSLTVDQDIEAERFL